MSNQPKSIRVAALQMACTKIRSENIAEATNLIRQAHAKGAELVVLQELFANEYFCVSQNHANFELAEPIPGPTSEYLCELAQELKIVLVASLFECRAPGLFHNTAIVIERTGEIVGKYRKMHIPDDPGYHEKFYFTPGDLGFQAFQTSVGKIGVCICWDQWFPESARLTALAGADVLVYPTAIGWLSEDKERFGNSQLNAWQTVMRAQAITNGIFVVAANRTGTQDNIQFWGNSFIADPYGNILMAGNEEQTTAIVADCDLNAIDTARTHWPFFRDRRIDAYGDLTKRMSDE